MPFSYIGRYNFIGLLAEPSHIYARRSFFIIFLNLKINRIKFHIYVRVIVFLLFFSFFMSFCLISRHFSLFLPPFKGKKKKMSPIPPLSFFYVHSALGPYPLAAFYANLLTILRLFIFSFPYYFLIYM